MCGITGYAVGPGGTPIDRGVLQRMTDVIAHRGPDADGFHVEAGVGLGHRRLSIIDVSGGDNPLYDERRRVALIFNGEIYDHQEHRAALDYAFGVLNLHKVYLVVDVDNARAVRAYERTGFVVEGELREEYFASGRYHDAYRMAVLQREHLGRTVDGPR